MGLEGTLCRSTLRAGPLFPEPFLAQQPALEGTASVPLPRQRCRTGVCVCVSRLRLSLSAGQAVGGGEKLGGGGGAGNTWRNVVEAASPGLPDLVIEGHFHTGSRIMGVGLRGFACVHAWPWLTHLSEGTCGTYGG